MAPAGGSLGDGLFDPEHWYPVKRHAGKGASGGKLEKNALRKDEAQQECLVLVQNLRFPEKLRRLN